MEKESVGCGFPRWLGRQTGKDRMCVCREGE